jgi:hypothetical protein
MRYLVAQTVAAGKRYWIVRDTAHSWLYHGPFADEALARSFAWKELLRAARARKAASTQEDQVAA